jgi:hypothetical protein
MKHNCGGLFSIFIEKGFEDKHHKFHRRIIIIKQKHLPHGWFLRGWPRFNRDIGMWRCAIILALIGLANGRDSDHLLSIAET